MRCYPQAQAEGPLQLKYSSQLNPATHIVLDIGPVSAFWASSRAETWAGGAGVCGVWCVAGAAGAGQGQGGEPGARAGPLPQLRGPPAPRPVARLGLVHTAATTTRRAGVAEAGCATRFCECSSCAHAAVFAAHMRPCLRPSAAVPTALDVPRAASSRRAPRGPALVGLPSSVRACRVPAESVAP